VDADSRRVDSYVDSYVNTAGVTNVTFVRFG